MMARKLKLHEQKLVKKVKNNLQEVKVMKKYYIPKREDYLKYNKLSRKIREIGNKIINLKASNDFRTAFSARLLDKLYQMGLITTRWDLELVTGVSASSFCRRRLPAVMVRNKMVENIKEATKLIEQGHVQVGSLVVKDPSYLVLRGHEDLLAWVNGSAIMGHVLGYNDMIVTDLSNQFTVLNKKIDLILGQPKDSYHQISEEGFSVPDFLKTLPVHEDESFCHLNEHLKVSENKQALVKFLRGIGGKDIRHFTVNMLRRILLDEVAEKYSLTGKRMKNSHKKSFLTTEVCTIIFEICKAVHNNATDAHLREIISDWLNQSKVRLARRSERQQILQS